VKRPVVPIHNMEEREREREREVQTALVSVEASKGPCSALPLPTNENKWNSLVGFPTHSILPAALYTFSFFFKG
jgi:hypothetical protein